MPTSNSCSLAIGMAVGELVGVGAAGVSVEKVAAVADRARKAMSLDSYAMSVALMFAQVRNLGVPCSTHALA